MEYECSGDLDGVCGGGDDEVCGRESCAAFVNSTDGVVVGGNSGNFILYAFRMMGVGGRMAEHEMGCLH